MPTGRTRSGSGSTPTRRRRPSPCCRVSACSARRGSTRTGDCVIGHPNPLIHVPAGISGTAEFPGGGDFLITLGLWDNTNFVGSDFGVASTTMHELGHTFGLGHGGDALPNCKPNYLSVMNYLFQLGGLIDARRRASPGLLRRRLPRYQRNGPERVATACPGPSGPAGMRRGPRAMRALRRSGSATA